MTDEPLPRSFYDRSPREVARDLIGKTLFRRTREGVCAGRIVETEAYLADGDDACHASRGRSRKNKSMFGPPGHLYVYCIHARWCLNAVTEGAGTGSAVLIRAVEPILGIEAMQRRRGLARAIDVCRGPARLCEAMDVHRGLDGWDLTKGRRVWIASADLALDFEIGESVRIGVTSARDLTLRNYERGNAYVSGSRSLRS